MWLARLHGRDGFNRRVAVKLMKEGNLQPDIVARQRDEARLLGLLQHPHIVAVYDLTEHNGLPAVIMEYVEGVDVSTLVKLTGPMPLAAATRMAAAVAMALDAGWNATAPDSDRPLRVIHRDIKPANVLVTVHGAVKVLDFGVARADFDREGRTQSMAFGTPRFMAPEQFLGGELGAGNDVYALAITLWEAVMGTTWERPPLAEERFAEKARAQIALAPEVLRPLLTRMLAWEAATRPGAAEVAEALEALPIEGESLRAYAGRVVPEALSRHAAALVERSNSGMSFGPPVSLPTPLDDSGTSLVTALPPQPGEAPPSGPPLALLALGGAVVLAGLLLLGVGGSWLALRDSLKPAEAPVVAEAAEAAPIEASRAPVEASAAPVEAPPTLPAGPAGGPARSNTASPPPETPGGPSAADLVAGLGEGEASKPVAAPAPVRPREPAPARPVAAAPVEAVVTPVPAPVEAAPEPVRQRDLRVLADVIGARVFVDGAAAGTTPIARRAFSYGSHRVEIEVDGVRASRTVEIDANTPSTLRYRSKEKSWIWE